MDNEGIDHECLCVPEFGAVERQANLMISLCGVGTKRKMVSLISDFPKRDGRSQAHHCHPGQAAPAHLMSASEHWLTLINS